MENKEGYNPLLMNIYNSQIKSYGIQDDNTICYNICINNNIKTIEKECPVLLYTLF